MDFALIQPPIWTNARTPWEIAYLKAYLCRLGFAGCALDLSLDTLPWLQEFASDVHAALDNSFESETFTASVNFLTTASEYLALTLLPGEDSSSQRKALEALIGLRTALSPEATRRVADVFIHTPYFGRVSAYLSGSCARICADRPRVVGAVSHITSLGFAALALREVKRRAPSTLTVLSGYQATMAPGAALEKFPWIDCVTVGENENPYRDILSHPPVPRSVVRSAGPIDLDSLPPADYGDMQLGRYHWLSVRAARNCPYRCTFCQENAYWDRCRVPSATHVVDEIAEQLAHCPQRHVDFVDLEMTGYAQDIAREILHRGLRVEWSGWMRPASRAPDYMQLLTASGCAGLTFGLESASPRILRAMRRLPHGAPEAIAADLRSCADHGIRTCLTAIAGFPGETREDWRMTLAFLRAHAPALHAAALQSFKALPRSPIGAEMPDAGRWPVRPVSIPALAPIEPLLYARNYEGTPSQRETIDRELEGRRVLSELRLAGGGRQGLLIREDRRRTDLLDLR